MRTFLPPTNRTLWRHRLPNGLARPRTNAEHAGPNHAHDLLSISKQQAARPCRARLSPNQRNSLAQTKLPFHRPRRKQSEARFYAPLRNSTSDGTIARSNPLEQREQAKHLFSSARRRKPDRSPRCGKDKTAGGHSKDRILPAQRECRAEASQPTVDDTRRRLIVFATSEVQPVAQPMLGTSAPRPSNRMSSPATPIGAEQRERDFGPERDHGDERRNRHKHDRPVHGHEGVARTGGIRL